MSDKSFTDKLYGHIHAQYDLDPRNSLIYRIKRDELKEQAKKTKKRYSYQAEYFIELREAYDKADRHGDVKAYLKLVLALLQKEGKEQIFIPTEKSELKRFCERWNRYLKAFAGDDRDVLGQIGGRNRSKVSKAIGEAEDIVNVGRDPETERLMIGRMQDELEDACVRRAVDEYFAAEGDAGPRTIARSIVDGCAGDEWFAELFSQGGIQAGKKENIKNDESIFASIIMKCMEEENSGREEIRNLFIPLYIDSITGVSLNIIGMDHCIDANEYEIPCGLAVIEADDAMMIPDRDLRKFVEIRKAFGRGNKSFNKSYKDFADNFISSYKAKDPEGCRKACERYFYERYHAYRDAVLKGRLLFMETGDGVLKNMPDDQKNELKSIGSYGEMFKTRFEDENLAEMARAELDRIGERITPDEEIMRKILHDRISDA